MLRTHCIGDTVVEYETWSVLRLITLCNRFGYVTGSSIGYCKVALETRSKFSHRTLPQCNLTQHQPSFTHNLTILVSSAAILVVSAPDGVDCSSGNKNGPMAINK